MKWLFIWIAIFIQRSLKISEIESSVLVNLMGRRHKEFIDNHDPVHNCRSANVQSVGHANRSVRRQGGIDEYVN